MKYSLLFFLTPTHILYSYFTNLIAIESEREKVDLMVEERDYSILYLKHIQISNFK